jgi:hypothetical protein
MSVSGGTRTLAVRRLSRILATDRMEGAEGRRKKGLSKSGPLGGVLTS